MDGGVILATSRYFIIKQSTRYGGLVFFIADGGIFQRDRFSLRRNFLPTKQDLAQVQAAFCFIDGGN
ncbi:hypothetical protein CGT92_00340 [Vibrio metoecus]|nr:hypothetical protein XV91_12805 [Vibrio metoecus]PAR58889.1 hypothetical protein CGT92_00340 [Vibrio metoecus]PAR70634.1 hypothetical protein CGT91_00755 [Vibrio metoecus]